jgi:hypothetical protein
LGKKEMPILKINNVRSVTVKVIPKQTLQLTFHFGDASKRESIQVDLVWLLGLAAVEVAAQKIGLLGGNNPTPSTRAPSGARGKAKLRIVR